MSEKKLCIIGASSIVSKELGKLYNHPGRVKYIGRKTEPAFCIGRNFNPDLGIIDLSYDHYCINLGILFGKNAIDINIDDALFSMLVNLIYPVKICEHILENNKKARIVIIGSESGEKGSFDTFYFLAKAALNSFVRERRISSPAQTINIINPSIFEDGGMTVARDDQDRVMFLLSSNPKEKSLLGKDVAQVIYYILNEPSGFLTNQVIGLNGGKFARM